MADRLEALMVPSSAPVDGPVGSGFGFRLDPIDGHRALHTGLDFPPSPAMRCSPPQGAWCSRSNTMPSTAPC
jgi:hypothetical protein